jgi:Fe2+ or Zn2+ uptake regulation protein
MTDTAVPVTETLERHLQNLADAGIRLSRTEIWVMRRCFENPASINQLADELDKTYQTAYRAVRKLEELRLLQVSFTVGKEQFFKCHFDVTKEASTQFFFRLNGEKISFEQICGMLISEENYLRSMQGIVGSALTHLYLRSLSVKKSMLPSAPTGVEVRSLLLDVARKHEEFAHLIRAIVETPIYEANEHVLPYMGIIDENFARFFSIAIQQAWGNSVSANGYKPKSQKEIGEETVKEFCKQHGFDYHVDNDEDIVNNSLPEENP